MSSEIEELRAEVAALRAMSTMVAPLVFLQAHISPETIVRIGQKMAEEAIKGAASTEGETGINAAVDIRAAMVRELFAETAATMTTIKMEGAETTTA